MMIVLTQIATAKSSDSNAKLFVFIKMNAIKKDAKWGIKPMAPVLTTDLIEFSMKKK